MSGALIKLAKTGRRQRKMANSRRHFFSVTFLPRETIGTLAKKTLENMKIAIDHFKKLHKSSYE